MRTTTRMLTRGSGQPATVLVTALLAACTAAPGASPTPTLPEASPRPTSAPPAAATVPPSPAPIIGEVPAGLVDAARTDLADRIGADAAAGAQVVVAESVTWPDGSLGCPVPGEMYVQVLTPGYRLVFEADGVRHDYRLTEAGAVRLCELRRPVP